MRGSQHQIASEHDVAFNVKIRGHRVSTDKAQIRHHDLQGRVPIKHPRRKGEVRIVVICPERVELSYRELNSTTIIACGYFPMLTNRTRLMSPAGYTVIECFNRHGCDSYVYLFTMRRPPSLSNSRRFACIIVRHRLFTVPHRRSKGEGLSSWRTELGRTQAV